MSRVLAAAAPAIRQLLRRNQVLLVLFAFGVFEGAALLGFFTFFAPALQGRGASASVAGAVMGGYGVATAAGSWLLGRFPDRLVPRLPLIAGGTAMVAGYLIAVVSQATATILAASVLGLAFSLFHSAFQAWVTELVPAARGVVTSLFVLRVHRSRGRNRLGRRAGGPACLRRDLPGRRGAGPPRSARLGSLPGCAINSSGHVISSVQAMDGYASSTLGPAWR